MSWRQWLWFPKTVGKLLCISEMVPRHFPSRTQSTKRIQAGIKDECNVIGSHSAAWHDKQARPMLCRQPAFGFEKSWRGKWHEYFFGRLLSLKARADFHSSNYTSQFLLLALCWVRLFIKDKAPFLWSTASRGKSVESQADLRCKSFDP